jgi:hypothetical protein
MKLDHVTFTYLRISGTGENVKRQETNLFFKQFLTKTRWRNVSVLYRLLQHKCDGQSIQGSLRLNHHCSVITLSRNSTYEDYRPKLVGTLFSFSESRRSRAILL